MEWARSRAGLGAPESRFATWPLRLASLLELPPHERPRCVLCHNDVMALGLLSGLLSRGVRVPEDIALAGFDGIAEGRFAPRALTSVACSPDEIARLSVERLLKRLGPDCQGEPSHILLRPQLNSGQTL